MARKRPNQPHENTSQGAEQVGRKKPKAGMLKCNVDAALFALDNYYGIGMCIRDENGCFMEGKTMWFSGSPETQEDEAMGLLQALKLLKDL